MESRYYNLIHSETELKYFFDNILYPLENDEVFFVSLSGRKKYLTQEERIEYDLGRTEMFGRRIIRDYTWEKFLRTIKKFNCEKGSYTTKNGKNIPEHCLVAYMNINPSSTIKAINNFTIVMNDYYKELSLCAINKRPLDNILNRIKRLDNNLMTTYQKSRGRKLYVDIDFDIPEKAFEAIQLFVEEVEDRGTVYHIIKTKSGYHVLLKIDTLGYDFNKLLLLPKMITRNIMEEHYPNQKWEIKINENEMIPIPGTFQAGFPIILINKNSNKIV